MGMARGRGRRKKEVSCNGGASEVVPGQPLYAVDVGLSNVQGQPVGTATAFADSLAPGGSVTATGSAYPYGPVRGMRCQLANVTRIPMATGGTGASGSPHLDLPHVGVPHPDLDLPHIHLGHSHK